MNRRNFLRSAAGAAGLALTKQVLARTAETTALTHKERVDRTLRGQDVDRPPFTFYLHYNRPSPQLEAQCASELASLRDALDHCPSMTRRHGRR